jgi:hypothetical protein
MTRAVLWAAVLSATVLLATAACVPEEGPMMEPGSDCLECHGGGEASQAWTAAGTMNYTNRTLLIQDAAGKTFTRPVNKVGNVWTSEPLTFPLRVSIDGNAMPDPVQASGASCNRAAGCHGSGGDGGGN